MQFTFIISFNPHTKPIKVAVILIHSTYIYTYYMPITASHCSKCEEYSLKAHRLGPAAMELRVWVKVMNLSGYRSMPQSIQLYVKMSDF